MALFKALRGGSARLNSQSFRDGFAYLTTDDEKFYIDAIDDNDNQKRIHINKTAYDYAVTAGFDGTEEEFGAAIVNMVDSQMLLGRFNKTTTWNDEETVYTETWTYNGDTYSDVYTNNDPVWTRQLSVNGVNMGLWTLTYDDDNNTKTIVYTAQ